MRAARAGGDEMEITFIPRRGRLVLGVLVVVLGVAAYRAWGGWSKPVVPSAIVTRGEFVDVVELRGDIRPVRSVVLTAPSQAGELQVIRLAKSGTVVKPGDLVVQFDSTSLDRWRLDRLAELKQAEAEIEQQRAQARITEEASATNLMRARFDVDRARFDVVDGPWLARIETERAKLALSDAEQRLKEAEKRQLADQAAAAARVAGRVRRRDRIRQDLDRIEKALASLELRAPAAGSVALMPNSRSGSASGSYQEFREGDRAWPGASIAELPDLSSVRLMTRLEEADRGRVEVGQTGTVHLDAVPDRNYRARISRISLLARVDFAGSWPPARDFDLELGMADPDVRLRPGMSATVRIAVGRLRDVLVVPSEAVFLVNGRPTVYRLAGASLEPITVTVLRRGREQIALASGVAPGDRVALQRPGDDVKR
ncbi:MAG: efflux RND transporter periplasmic adaptor subunit [Bacteroidales bacterium]